MNKRFCLVFAALMAVPVALFGQEKPQAPAAAPAAPPANPITASEKGLYSFVSNAAIGAAVKMPEENYSFKPTPEVRSFGQIVGHVADASYMFCSQAAGETMQGKDIEKTKTSKADLVAALKDAVAYCNKSLDGMTDAKGSQMMKLFNFNLAKLTVLSINTAHTDEHYGNMVTYLRLKGIVPPTSENPPPQAPK
ncbi:MAG TPA: DinB family protein [Candidatus Acidoferrum sp.]|nr:DinB family protein [Candidatus Acidoferrum sp.]